MKNKSIKGYINGVLASISYGTNPLFALPMYKAGLGVNSVLFYRYFFAVLIYGLWIKFAKKSSFKITFKEGVCLFILAVLFSLSSLLLFDSFNYMEAGLACTILFVYPVIVAIISSLFFKEKITLKIIVSIFLTTIGILFLYNGKPDEGLNLKGVLSVLLSALSYALYIIGVKNIKIVKHIKYDKLSFYIMFFGLFVYIFNLRFCSLLEPLNSPSTIICALMMSLIPTVISIETINVAIKLIGSTKTAILGALEPLTALFFGVVIFDETLTLRIMLGVALILFGVILIVLKNKKKV